ncbi:uncharacterized protein A4U43_C03F3010 [Asparagus officinalis]|uniref:Uncharacterized protein n=1 Tax=Asparagus officinalis TaxID=4686 RepID=A0A5P1F8P7_ASPOF|nr:uncharacterized protein A4U43_C03F3010 [Asparagus officinalis]
MLAITLDMALQVILLDTRYHRDPFFSDGSILGETQWEWLQQELSGAGSEITIIASSIQDGWAQLVKLEWQISPVLIRAWLEYEAGAQSDLD